MRGTVRHRHSPASGLSEKGSKRPGVGGSKGGTMPLRLQSAPARAEKDEKRVQAEGGRTVVILRQEIGDVLRDARRQQGRTLREVSTLARVSLGYLSEVERGQKEASSELLASICGALEVPLSSVLREVSARVAVAESLMAGGVPDTVPDDLAGEVALRDVFSAA